MEISIEQLKKDNITLIHVMDELLDYTLGMKMVTRYTTDSAPDLLYMIRLINLLGGEYFEIRQRNKKKEEGA